MAHVPVLREEVLSLLDPKPGENFVDTTIGAGGHSAEILKRIAPSGRLLGIDWNDEAILSLEKKFSREIQKGALMLRTGNFASISDILFEANFPPPDGILSDLGMSSEEIEESGRGFSFRRDEPLLMTYDANPSQEALTAGKIINTFSETELIHIFREFGEERYAGRYGRAIVAARRIKPIQSTIELAEIIERISPIRKSGLRGRGAFHRRRRIHPATKIFQALRITVNQELDNLSLLIRNGFSLMASGGRMLVISYHSLEDRIVKWEFRERAAGKFGKILTKKPITPSFTEVEINPRARSAKLRAISKF